MGGEAHLGGCMTGAERAAFSAALALCDAATVDYCPEGMPTHFDERSHCGWQQRSVHWRSVAAGRAG